MQKLPPSDKNNFKRNRETGNHIKSKRRKKTNSWKLNDSKRLRRFNRLNKRKELRLSKAKRSSFNKSKLEKSID